MKVNVPNAVVAAFAVLFMFMLLLAFGYGVAVIRYQLFPAKHVAAFEEAIKWSLDAVGDEMSWYYQPTDRTAAYTLAAGVPEPEGLNLVTAMGPNKSLTLKVIDMKGEMVHQWPVDWFDVWPDADHLPPGSIPQTRPGTHIHGTLLLPDGDVIYNYEKQGTVRMDICGNVKWRLPYQTHHSVYLDENDVLWFSGLRTHTEKLANYPTHKPPVMEQTILTATLDGEILNEVSMLDLLAVNDQMALIQMRAAAISSTISGDNLHLNDIETFPESMEEGFFRHGDVLASLRNINSLVVFDKDWNLKFLKVGGFVRQHDPDFIDGNTIMLFDNNTIGPRDFGQQSRILLLDGPTGELTVKYQGTKDHPFYTHIMGKQQLLENGHVVITDSINGRGFEIDTEGNVIWEFVNIVEPGIIGVVEEVHRIPDSFRTVLAASSCLAN